MWCWYVHDDPLLCKPKLAIESKKVVTCLEAPNSWSYVFLVNALARVKIFTGSQCFTLASSKTSWSCFNTLFLVTGAAGAARSLFRSLLIAALRCMHPRVHQRGWQRVADSSELMYAMAERNIRGAMELHPFFWMIHFYTHKLLMKIMKISKGACYCTTLFWWMAAQDRSKPLSTHLRQWPVQEFNRLVRPFPSFSDMAGD